MWQELLLFVGVGFMAQIVDGAIGMAYGVTATSVLLAMGVPPATASATVHAAEVFTTGTSGIAHWRRGNVRFDLIKSLALPGMIGGGIGAYVLTAVDGDQIRPFINVYLIMMGCIILWKALRKVVVDAEPPRYLAPLGLFGGFFDAIGGGGWGPMVASTLIGRGMTPRFAIGSVNAAEFFVTCVVSATFITTLGLTLWPMIIGLIVGGVLAAPLAAYVTQRLEARRLMIAVGILVIAISVRELFNLF